MTLSELGALGELIGGVAVVVSLVYLAIQIRDSTKAARASRVQAVLSESQAFLRVIAADTPSARVFRLGLADSGELSEDERAQFTAQLMLMFRNFENMFVQYQLRDRDDLAWQSGVAALERFVGFPGSQKFWSDRSDAYTPEFRKVVDSIRERSHAAAHQIDEVGL